MCLFASGFTGRVCVSAFFFTTGHDTTDKKKPVVAGVPRVFSAAKISFLKFELVYDTLEFLRQT